MLLAWVCALGAGVVNACLVEPATAEHAAAVRVAAPTHTQHEVDAPAPPAPDGTDGHTPCAKFCGDESTGVPSAKQSSQPADTPALPVATPVALPADDAAVPPRAAAQPPPRWRAPVTIVLLKLIR